MAQDTAPEDAQPDGASQDADTPADDDIIYVYAASLRGRVDAAQPPVLELDAEDIAAYGAGSIAELIEALGPQVSSGRGRGGGGRPIILVNGVRISSFRELRSYPPEAIERTEVFTEEVAQQYGYSPDARVVNIILKDNFSSREVELEYSQPFDGGTSRREVEGTYLRIDGPSRLNVNLEYSDTSPLTEAERGIIQADGSVPSVAGDPDPAEYRTLVSDSNGIEGTANWTTSLSPGTSLSLNATYEREDSLRLQGLDTVLLTGPAGDSELRAFNEEDPLTIDSRSNSCSAGATLAGDLGAWQVTGTLDATLTDARSRTQRRLDTASLVAQAAAGTLALDATLGPFTEAGFDEALSDTYRLEALVTARGQLVTLPAGDVSVTLDAGYVGNGIESSDTRNPSMPTDLDRTRWSAGANLGIPLTSRDDDFLGAVGDVALALAAGVDHLSDFGTLYDWTAGLTWGATDNLTLSATYINRDSAPSLTQLGAPQIVTPNVSVFDLSRNETVLATLITGGNPALPAQAQSDWKFGLNWELPFLDNASVQLEYFDNHSDDTTESFPLLTPEIEAAFPARITRDAGGRLVELDSRFVTFAEQDVRRLQVGFNVSGSFGEDEERISPGRQESRAGPPAGAGPRGGPGGRDPQRMAAMRAQFCEAEPAAMLERLDAALAAAANGEEPPLGPDGEPVTIPPRMLERLAGEDGRIDPERFARARERICSADPAQSAGAQRRGPPPGARAGQRPRGGFGRGPRGGGDGGRWFLNLQYTRELENTVLIAPGLPRLDLLEGDALAGALPTDTLSVRGGVFHDGFGALAFVSYQGESRIEGSGLPGSTDLFFDNFATVRLRLFADLGRRESLVQAVPFFEGARISLSLANLFDARQRVTDSNGDTPLRYQPFLLDPYGRTFEIEFRKLF